MQIRHVVDASCFYVNLLEHRDFDGHLTPLSTERAELSMNMAQYFTLASNRHLIGWSAMLFYAIFILNLVDETN